MPSVTKCYECGRPVATDASSCPHCDSHNHLYHLREPTPESPPVYCNVCGEEIFLPSLAKAFRDPCPDCGTHQWHKEPFNLGRWLKDNEGLGCVFTILLIAGVVVLSFIQKNC